MPAVQETIDQVKEIDIDQYKYGFSTDIEVDKAPKGLNEDIIRFISAKKDEPQWMLDWRLGWGLSVEQSAVHVSLPSPCHFRCVCVCVCVCVWYRLRLASDHGRLDTSQVHGGAFL